jgi:hypothetical protein
MSDSLDYFAEDCQWPLWTFNVDGFRDIDVIAELRHKTILAMFIIEDAVGLARVLWRPLAMLKEMPGWLHSDGDDLEQHAATSLMKIDELLRQQIANEAPPLPSAAVKDLKLLQQFAQDIVVLASCRFIDQRMLQDRGIPRSIVIRWKTSFCPAALQNDDLWSRLGNSKYQIFNKGFSGPLTSGIQGNP